MSQENVELVRAVYEALARGDVDEIYDTYYDPEIEWDVRGSLGELLGGRIHRGREDVRGLIRQLYDAWEQYELRLDELIDGGADDVVAVVTSRARGRASGIQLEQTDAAVWTVRDRKVKRVVWYSTVDEALEAVGLRE